MNMKEIWLPIFSAMGLMLVALLAIGLVVSVGTFIYKVWEHANTEQQTVIKGNVTITANPGDEVFLSGNFKTDGFEIK